MKRRWFALAIAVASLKASLSQADACNEADRMETDFGQVQSIEGEVPSGQIVDAVGWINEAPSYRYFKALVRVEPVAGLRWTLYVRDKSHRVVDVVTEKHTSATGSAWTGRIDLQSSIYFDFLATPPAAATLQVSRLMLMPTEAINPYYSVQPGQPRFVDLPNAPVAARLAGDSVGMLVGSWDNKGWCCSAVAVGPDLVLTNWHCGGAEKVLAKEQYWQQSVCDRTVFDFSWDGDVHDREFQCKEVLQIDPQTDTALLRVVPRNGNDALRPVRSWSSASTGGALAMIQHPACRPKQLTQGGLCKTAAARIAGSGGVKDADFSHTCDTMSGSSGAPVFDSKFRLVGLHHRGFEAKQGKCDMINKAIRAETIVNRMNSRAIDALGKRPAVDP